MSDMAPQMFYGVLLLWHEVCGVQEDSRFLRLDFEHVHLRTAANVPRSAAAWRVHDVHEHFKSKTT